MSSSHITLVTGATTGIGRSTALQLANLGHSLILVGRDPAKLDQVLRELKAQSPHVSHHAYLADLSLQQDIRTLSEKIIANHPTLHHLINNAGSWFSDRLITSEGFEKTWALNHLAYVRLTLDLIPLLRKSPQARIINVASNMHSMGKIELNNLQGERRYRSYQIYANSKLANVLFTFALARRLSVSAPHVTVNALHPGAVKTGMGRDMSGLLRFFNRWMQQLFFLSPDQGAATSVYLATSPEVTQITGKYFTRCRPVSPSAKTLNLELQETLWSISCQQCGFPPHFSF